MKLRFLFAEVYDLIASCHRKPLTAAEVFPLDTNITSSHVYRRYERAVEDDARLKHSQRHDEKQRQPDAADNTPINDALETTNDVDEVARLVQSMGMVRALFLLNRNALLLSGLYACVRIVGMFLQVFSLWQLLLYVSDRAWNDAIGIQVMYCVLMGLGSQMQSTMQHNITHIMYEGGLRGRGLICTLVLDKAMQMTPLHRSKAAKPHNKAATTSSPSSSSPPPSDMTEVSTGQLMNFITSDTNAVVDAFIFAIYIPSTFVEAIGSLLWTYAYCGWSFTITFVVMLLFLPLQSVLGTFIRERRDASFRFADQRIRAVSEFLGGITLVKFCAWEEKVEELLANLRSSEERHLLTGAAAKIMNVTFFFFLPGLLYLTQFGVMTADGRKLDAVNTFVTMALLQICARTYHMIPRAATSAATAMSAINRIEAFLQTDVTRDLAKWDATSPSSPSPTVEVRGTFGWHGFKLEDVALTARAGSLTVVVGPVGSGKSTLLHTLLGNCAFGRDDVTDEPLPYTLRRPKSVAYVSQEAWIRDGTVRDNILLGNPSNRAATATCCTRAAWRTTSSSGAATTSRWATRA